MKYFLLVSLSSLMLLSAACKKQDDKPLEMKQVNLTEKQKMVIESSNSFGFDFFRAANGFAGEENFMFSPLSISMALGMTRNGAAGSTLDSMTNTLRFAGMSEQEINDSYKYLMETFTMLDPEVKLLIANSIWYKESYSIEPDFLNTNATYFNAEVNAADFNDPATLTAINSWVSDNTLTLIPKILDEIDDEYVMFLINAVYFKGQWKNKFEESNTTHESFFLSDGSTIQAPAMKQNTNLSLLTREGFSAVELPYNQGNFNMSVILPDAGVSTDDVIAQLTQDNWTNWQSMFLASQVELQLPKFKFSYNEEKMKEILTDMGMGIAFEGGVADFTRINSNGGLYISIVKHKTFIETDEKGSTAAAATLVGMRNTSAGPDDPLQFIVNRPFIFLINEKSTGTIMFIGVVNNPLAQGEV